MNFDETPEFQKDVKALRKRVRTLAADIERVKPRVAALYVLGDSMSAEELTEFRNQFFDGRKATILSGSTDEVEVIKMRLDTDTDQFRTKLRLVFVAIRRGNSVRFVEIYSKSDKLREDSRRIERCLKELYN
jgi:hypothetical protein